MATRGGHTRPQAERPREETALGSRGASLQTEATDPQKKKYKQQSQGPT